MDEESLAVGGAFVSEDSSVAALDLETSPPDAFSSSVLWLVEYHFEKGEEKTIYDLLKDKDW